MTPTDIETLTRDELYGKFPYEDCHWLRNNTAAGEELIPDLDIYFSDIAGFSSSASRLAERHIEQLEAYWPSMQLNFFEKFPQHKPLQEKINETDTPTLARELRSAEIVRLELLPLIHKQIEAKRLDRQTL